MSPEFDIRKVVDVVAGNGEAVSVRRASVSEAHMTKVMNSYIENINNPDPGFAVFADEFEGEDPVGAGPLSAGDVWVRYDSEFFTPKRAELISPVRTSFGNSAAMAFRFFAEVNGRDISIDIIDVMTFDDAGKITQIHAYWGVDNISIL